ncbi:serine protease inhibitor A3K-like [Tropilaelaps mercedesae]|uniref:Serine protease inhibitor A3K-like n=1 Tax=Tropilaelaps mercedesae TaxID=418985 RepID=A0A1V9XLS0_9ACAR|nr:serine protease inhibitor A3K-like [Tropilaelaps mercedesae]
MISLRSPVYNVPLVFNTDVVWLLKMARSAVLPLAKTQYWKIEIEKDRGRTGKLRGSPLIFLTRASAQTHFSNGQGTMRLFLACAALAGMSCAMPSEVTVSGRYRAQAAQTVSPMANITNYLGYMVFRSLPEEDKIVSPISLLEVLFMLYFGAAGTTKGELDKVLQFSRYGLANEEKIVYEIAYVIHKWKQTKGEIMDLTRAYSSDQASMSREGLFYNNGKEEAYAMYMYKDSDVELGFNKFAHSVTLRLPYENTDYDMYIIGPYGNVDGRQATIQNVEQFLKQTKTYEPLLKTEKKPNDTIGVEVPRFVVSSEVDLKTILSRFGIESLFVPGADLTGMSPARLHVSSMKQAGYAKIDEQGTEAGVVTASTASSRMVPTRLPKTVTFNKPFLFLIRNNRLHLDLFLGKISNVPKSND